MDSPKPPAIEELDRKSQQARSRLYTPLLKQLDGLGITATTITNIRLGLAILGFFLFQSDPLLGALLILFALLLDTIDGALARFQNTASDRGKFMDVFVDQLVYSFTLLALLWIGMPPMIVAYNILIVGATHALAIIKKGESQETDWIIKPVHRLSYLKAIGNVAFFLFAFISVDVVIPALTLSNVLATVLGTYYLMIIQKRWR